MQSLDDFDFITKNMFSAFNMFFISLSYENKLNRQAAWTPVATNILEMLRAIYSPGKKHY